MSYFKTKQISFFMHPGTEPGESQRNYWTKGFQTQDNRNTGQWFERKKTSEGDPQVPQGVQTLEQGEGSKQGLGIQAEILEEWMLLDILYHNGKYRTRKMHRRQTDRQTGTERWRELWRLQGGPLSKDIWALCGQELPGLSKSHWKRAGWEIAGVTQSKKNLCSQQPEWNQNP